MRKVVLRCDATRDQVPAVPVVLCELERLWKGLAAPGGIDYWVLGGGGGRGILPPGACWGTESWWWVRVRVLLHRRQAAQQGTWGT